MTEKTQIRQKQLKDTGERIVPGNQAFNYSFQHHLFAYRWALNHCSDKVVLDAGCGEGYGSKILAENAAQIIGIDKSREAISWAKACYQAPNLSFQVTDVYNLPFDDNSFDLVCSFQVIEHLKYPDKYLKQLSRVLTNKGTLLISTPNRIQFGAEYHLKIPFHHKEFIPEEFKEMLQNHFSRTEIFGLWGNKRISLLHDLDKQAILKLVKMDPLKIRKIIPRKFYELVYPYLWKRSRKISYHSYKSLIDSITTDDFHLEALSNNSDDISYWDIYSISHNSK